jgi:hypothetical protein
VVVHTNLWAGNPEARPQTGFHRQHFKFLHYRSAAPPTLLSGHTTKPKVVLVVQRQWEAMGTAQTAYERGRAAHAQGTRVKAFAITVMVDAPRQRHLECTALAQSPSNEVDEPLVVTHFRKEGAPPILFTARVDACQQVHAYVERSSNVKSEAQRGRKWVSS